VAAQLSPVERSYVAKYPGDSGQSVRAVAEELINRLKAANAVAAPPRPAAKAHEPASETAASKPPSRFPSKSEAAVSAPGPAAAAAEPAAAPVAATARPAPVQPLAVAAAEERPASAPRVVRVVPAAGKGATPPPPQSKPTLIK
jgi:hypothetical protein